MRPQSFGTIIPLHSSLPWPLSTRTTDAALRHIRQVGLVVLGDGTSCLPSATAVVSCSGRRMYIEQFTVDKEHLFDDAQEALWPIIDVALRVSRLAEFTGRDKPTVIT